MPETKSTTIGGVRFEMRLLAGRQARAVAARINPLILHGLQVALPMLKGAGASKKLDQLDWGDLGGLVGGAAAVFEQLGDEDQEYLVQTFARVTTVFIVNEADGKEHGIDLTLRLDDLFVGKPYSLYEWLIWAVQQNGFFDFRALLAKLPRAERAAPSASPTASTGSSGASSSPSA